MTTSRSFQEEFPVTAFLLLFILAFYALEFIATTKAGGGDFDGNAGILRDVDGRALVRLGSLYSPLVAGGEYWRLISCTFLHGSLLHLFFNGLFLFDFGRVSEPLLSRWRFLTIYVVSGLGSSLTSYAILQGNSVGASGALCGLVGALLAYSIRNDRPEMRESLRSVVIWLIFISFVLPRVDWAGHAGGFVVGLVFGWFTPEYTSSASAERWRYPGYVAVTVVGGCLIMALRNHFLQ